MNLFSFFDDKELKDAAPLTLSMIGDAVHTLYVRNKLFSENRYRNNELHSLAAKEVCATHQAVLAKRMEPLLTEDELFIYKKGKNAKVNSVPKNAELMEYKLATGFEALVGYLFLKGEEDRIAYLLAQIETQEKVPEEGKQETENKETENRQ